MGLEKTIKNTQIHNKNNNQRQNYKNQRYANNNNQKTITIITHSQTHEIKIIIIV